MKRYVMVSILFLMITAPIFSEKKEAPRYLAKSAGISDIWADANRLGVWFRNNSVFAYDFARGDWGAEWPIGSGVSPMFAAGMFVGTTIGDEVRVAGTQHDASEYQPGEILSPGTAADPDDLNYRWYVIRADGSGDWNNWPAEQGAPVDAEGEPLLTGDFTAFCVYNDLGCHTQFGSEALGVEVRQTVWAFDRISYPGDAVFMKWQIVNRSDTAWDNTCLSVWADPDIGYGYDDFVGCDTVLNLGYCYNSANEDENYGTAPPAAGYAICQGPLVDAAGSAVTLPGGTELQDKNMLGMTSFVNYNCDDTDQGCPQNAGDLWHYQNGRWRDGSPITADGEDGTNPAYPVTTFLFTGDPETGEGWLDYNTSDRRFLMSSGPFPLPVWEDTDGDGLPGFGEPGVQEITVCLAVARGESHVNSVTRLKEVTGQLQDFYMADYQFTDPPVQPNVSFSEYPSEIILTWDDRSEFDENGMPYTSQDPLVHTIIGDTITTTHNGTLVEQLVVDNDTYHFYGYEVYQYSDAAGSDPVLIGRWDSGLIGEPTTYTGERFLRITENQNPVVGEAGSPLINNKAYYFGVTALGYLAFSSPPVISSDPDIVTATPQITTGARYQSAFSDTVATEHTVTGGTTYADADAIVRIVDPAAVTGHDYEIYFNQQHYYRDVDGLWHTTGYPDSIGKAGDLTGTSMTGVAVTAYPAGTVDLVMTLDLVAQDYSYCDGCALFFPDNVTVNSAEDAVGNNFGDTHEPVIDHTANSVTWGDTVRSLSGDFIGFEVFMVNVSVSPDDFPLEIAYVVFDDGWGETYLPTYGLDYGVIVDYAATFTIPELGYAFKTENHWNVRDADTDLDVLTDRTDLYPEGVDGSSAPVFEGLQVIIDGTFDAPHGFIGESSACVTPTYSYGLGEGGTAQGYYEIDGYGVYNWSYGEMPGSSRCYYAIEDPRDGSWGYGTQDVNMLSQDYEFRFSGVWDDTSVNAITVLEGTGQSATIFRNRSIGGGGLQLADHPLNPNPGVDEAFTIRIPMEVWNTTTGEQVNYCLEDREQTVDADPFWAFNPNGRMYGFICNTPYDGEVHDPFGADAENMTWNQVWWVTRHAVGDVLGITYVNPIQPGIDEFHFSTAGLNPVITDESLESDVEKIRAVPNPYYGVHSGEIGADRWIMFTYLPQSCTLRIFDLSGHLVRKIDKDSDESSLRWNLKNAQSKTVASSIYVYHVDMGDLGVKVGKCAVFMVK